MIPTKITTKTANAIFPKILLMITTQEVQHIAKLAKLDLSQEEYARFTPQLGKILEFFGELSEVNTDGVPETSQVTGLKNITRSDEIRVDGQEEALLHCSPHEVKNHSVKIPKIM